MKNPLIIILVGLAFLSSVICCDKNPVRAKLADIDSYAASNPDSARRALEAIDQDFLNTRRLKAQYALMLSTALSRCEIKVPNDSLINIAVDYYKVFGPKKERFLSYYYKGRVYHDLEDYESAMINYLEAEGIHSKDIPLRYLTSIQMKKGEIYQHYYDYDKAVDAYRKAQVLALQCDWKSNYFFSLFGELTQHIIFNKRDQTDSLIQCILPFKNEMTLRHRMTFAGRIIQASWSSADNDSLLSIAQEYEQNYSSLNGFQWDLLSTCYTKAGALADAERTLKVFKEQIDDPSSNLRYLKAFVELTDSLGLQEESQKAKTSFQELLGRQVYNKGTSDLRFLEERKIRDNSTKRTNHLIIFGAVAVLLLCVLVFFELRKRRKQKERIGVLYDSLKEEYAQMSALLQNNSNIQDEARTLLGQRVKSLAQFLSADPPSSLNRVADQLDSLTENRKELLETIGLLYAMYHPAFVNSLQDFGLSNKEIGYCCLLVLGFRTGEIGDVINRSSSYHISSAIRQKVGLGPNDTNLSIFMKKLYRETEKQDS